MRESTIIANMQRVDAKWNEMLEQMALISIQQKLLLKVLVDKKIISLEDMEKSSEELRKQVEQSGELK